MKYKILCVGNQWRGSDDGSVFRAFARAGHLISIVDDKLYVPTEVRSFSAKVARRLGQHWFAADFNSNLIRELDLFQPDVVCIYKGFNVYASTIREIKRNKIPVFCIYPDVSLFDHGGNIPTCIPLYDYIFTTKSFGLTDLKNYFGYTAASLIRHCADPDVHRPVDTASFAGSHLQCDASFIGSHSIKKEKLLMTIVQSLPSCQLKIWGGYWANRKTRVLDASVQSSLVMGDLYALAIYSSRINLGILSEAGGKASRGDQITSRTFHIPGSGGFLLHERTAEFLEIFEEGAEAACFDTPDELVEKVAYYLQHEEKRQQIARAGYEKVMSKHISDIRVNEIISILQEKGIIKA